MATEQYDAVVIGAGQGGDPLARAWAGAGHKTALIERAEVGGTCINTGCTPTKTMIASAREAYLARRAGDYGVQATVGGVDLAKVRERKRSIVESFRSGDEEHIASIENLTLLRGDAAFTGPKTLSVRMHDGTTQEITAEQIFINTGASPTIPPIDGLDGVPYLTNASIEELDQIPAHLLVLGGNYIGLEFGQMFRRFGSEVTIIENASSIISREDDDIAEAVTKILRDEGIQMVTDAKATSVRQSDEMITLTLETPEGTRTVTGTHLLVAVGRTPNTKDLGLDKAGIDTDDIGHVRANERLETNVPGIWVIGDVKGGPQFTHISYDDFRILEANLLKNGHRSTTDRLVPNTTFIDPQLGRVGLSEKEARAKGLDIKVATLPMTDVARAIETDETRGLMKAIVDAKTDQILGCAILGAQGGETMAVLQVAMMGKLPYTVIRDGVFAHPTWAESLNNLFLALDD
jgi:pyruvate/2-oxoglutarate dehydrogenase complex dihydrolipoamide dehydrogenase (E3) component